MENCVRCLVISMYVFFMHLYVSKDITSTRRVGQQHHMVFKIIDFFANECYFVSTLIKDYEQCMPSMICDVLCYNELFWMSESPIVCHVYVYVYECCFYTFMSYLSEHTHTHTHTPHTWYEFNFY